MATVQNVTVTINDHRPREKQALAVAEAARVNEERRVHALADALAHVQSAAIALRPVDPADASVAHAGVNLAVEVLVMELTTHKARRKALADECTTIWARMHDNAHTD